MLLDVAFDGGLQIDDGMEDAALQSLPGQGGEETLDGIEPRARCRREVEDPARVPLEPGHDLGMLVGAVVVEDDMDHLAGRHLALDGVEKADELLVTVLLHAATDHRAVENVEGGEQGGGAIALVIVGHRFAFAGFERQAGLGTIERLDLRFLVDRQDEGVGRRRHVKADDVLKFGNEVGVVRALEGSETMRLQLVSLPDPLNRAQRDAHDLGHGAARPVRDLARRFAAGQRDQPLDIGVRHRRLAGLSAAFTEKAIDACLSIPPLPAPDRRPADTGKPGDLGNIRPNRRMQNDPGTSHMFLRPVTIGDDRFQANTILSRDKGAHILGHALGIAYPSANVNPMNTSMH